MLLPLPRGGRGGGTRTVQARVHVCTSVLWEGALLCGAMMASGGRQILVSFVVTCRAPSRAPCAAECSITPPRPACRPNRQAASIKTMSDIAALSTKIDDIKEWFRM